MFGFWKGFNDRAPTAKQVGFVIVTQNDTSIW